MNVLIRNTKDLEITIENPAGSERHGEDWIQVMAHDYGYIEDTIGADGDEMDCFVGPNLDSDKVFVVEQKNEKGDFDEHKVMLGFSNIAEAKDAYFANYPEDWDGLKNISEIEDFWEWYEGLNKKENGMDTMVKRKEYKFENSNSAEMICRGKHIYGTKIDNSTCPCPDCEGGGRLLLYACRNCKGTGKVNKKTEPCADCDGQGTTDGEHECKSCNGTGLSMSS